MSFDYTELQTVATELIGEFGGNVTITHVTVGTHDAITGVISGVTTTQQTVKAVLFDYTNKESGAANIDGEVIRSGDKKMLVSANDLTADIVLTDTVTVSGTVWRVMNIKITRPAAVTIIYEVQLRR